MPKSWFPFHWSHTSAGLPAALSARDRMTCAIHQRGQAGPWERLPTKPARVHSAVPSYPLWAPCQERLWCFCLHSVTVSRSTSPALTLGTSACSSPAESSWRGSESPSGAWSSLGPPPHRCVGAPPGVLCLLSLPTFSWLSRIRALSFFKCDRVRNRKHLPCIKKVGPQLPPG